MQKKEKKKNKDVKVTYENYTRLRLYQNKMEHKALESAEPERYSMDRVIGALLDFVESSEIKLEKENAQTKPRKV